MRCKGLPYNLEVGDKVYLLPYDLALMIQAHVDNRNIRGLKNVFGLDRFPYMTLMGRVWTVGSVSCGVVTFSELMGLGIPVPHVPFYALSKVVNV